MCPGAGEAAGRTEDVSDLCCAIRPPRWRTRLPKHPDASVRTSRVRIASAAVGYPVNGAGDRAVGGWSAGRWRTSALTTAPPSGELVTVIVSA